MQQPLRFLVLWCLLFGAAARAGGILMGKVTRADSPWDAVPGVTVTAVLGPDDLRPGITDEHGEYRLEDLPPGKFFVIFDKQETASTATRDIQLEEGQTLRMDVRLVEGPDEAETLEWGFHKTLPPTRFQVNGRFFPSLKNQRPARDQGNTLRSVDSVLELAAGAHVSNAGLSLHGASGREADYRLDGLSTVDPAFGTNTLPLHAGFLDSIDLSWSGTDAMSGGATGARIDATSTPTAFRVFSGSAFMSWAPGVLEGARASLASDEAIPHTTSLGNLGDFGGTFTGPIIPKRLAVYLGVAPILSRSRVSSATTPFLDQRGVQAIAKLTFKPRGLPGSLDLTFITAPTEWTSALAATSEASRPASAHSTTTKTGLAFTGSLGETELQARVGWLHRQGDLEAPRNEPGAPTTTDFARTSPPFSTDRYQVNAQVARTLTLLGNHRLKAGIDAEALRYAHATSRVDTGTSVPGPEVRTRGTVLGAYVQDSWAPPFSHAPDLNVGVRYDAQRILPTDGGPTLHLGEQVSPRLELVFDDPLPLINFRLFARYGATVSLLPLSLAERTAENPSALVAPTSRDVLLGLRHLSFGLSHLTVTYLHRKLAAPMDGLLRTPASRAPERRYEALSVVFQQEHDFENLRFHLSYTRSSLTEKGAGRVRAPFAQRTLDGGWPTLLDASVSDRPDSIKLYVVRNLPSFHAWRPTLSLSYIGESGAWMEEAPTRLPWVHTIDASATFLYWIAYTGRVTLELDILNVFNFQAVTRTDALGVPAEYQPPRQLRLQARYDF
ncbi:TonB-dependent receptor [Myxococcus landrumensis]|uniref:TonB-dependent receptor n=1 Tax=Myxococcus landrumensis TaxID=2813577 RepID=A0ABX7N8N3_9BACT|nr:TonB-dependent receptor [Myxococcus landrumus]QSQ15117.1 TonB-dependent receptor [Myxococcus landrumus]